MRSKILDEFLEWCRSQPDYAERVHGTHLMARWNIELGNRAICMMSGAMEDECGSLTRPFQEIFYNEIEDCLNIEICSSKIRNSDSEVLTL
jgi:hypothetical protein